LGPNQAELV